MVWKHFKRNLAIQTTILCICIDSSTSAYGMQRIFVFLGKSPVQPVFVMNEGSDLMRGWEKLPPACKACVNKRVLIVAVQDRLGPEQLVDGLREKAAVATELGKSARFPSNGGSHAHLVEIAKKIPGYADMDGATRMSAFHENPLEFLKALGESQLTEKDITTFNPKL